MLTAIILVVYIILVFLGAVYKRILSQRAVKPKTTNQLNPVMSGMRTQSIWYSCYHVYSKVSDKNASRSIDSDLTTLSTILDSKPRRLVVV